MSTPQPSELSMDDSPFHDGERAVQARLGVRERVENLGRRMIRDHLLEEHRELLQKLPYLILGASDLDGRLWASLFAGAPGFIHTPDERTLVISARPGPSDPAGHGLARGTKIALLGIELSTRRRIRVNGTLLDAGSSSFTVRVDQSFGNCPKYIQARTLQRLERAAARSASEGVRLSSSAVELVQRADTFFIASTSVRPPASHTLASDPRAGFDVSHRGGRPGFVLVSRDGDATRLIWPEYRGNFLFNTLGNLVLNPRAGLLFIDFRSGTTLSLTGHAEVIWSQSAEAEVRFEVESGVLIENAFPFTASEADPAQS